MTTILTCRSCGQRHVTRQPVCGRCGRRQLAAAPLAGAGVVAAVTTVRGQVPVHLAVVSVGPPPGTGADDGLAVLARTDRPLRIGQRVTVRSVESGGFAAAATGRGDRP